MNVFTGLYTIVLTGMTFQTLTHLIKRIGRRSAITAAVRDLALLVEEQRGDLAYAHDLVARQGRELAELQERLDFAERLLAQGRARPPLPELSR